MVKRATKSRLSDMQREIRVARRGTTSRRVGVRGHYASVPEVGNTASVCGCLFGSIRTFRVQLAHLVHTPVYS